MLKNQDLLPSKKVCDLLQKFRGRIQELSDHRDDMTMFTMKEILRHHEAGFKEGFEYVKEFLDAEVDVGVEPEFEHDLFFACEKGQSDGESVKWICGEDGCGECVGLEEDDKEWNFCPCCGTKINWRE